MGVLNQKECKGIRLHSQNVGWHDLRGSLDAQRRSTFHYKEVEGAILTR